MKFEVVIADIAKQTDIEAVVNSANANLRFGSGVAGVSRILCKWDSPSVQQNDGSLRGCASKMQLLLCLPESCASQCSFHFPPPCIVQTLDDQREISGEQGMPYTRADTVSGRPCKTPETRMNSGDLG